MTKITQSEIHRGTVVRTNNADGTAKWTLCNTPEEAVAVAAESGGVVVTREQLPGTDWRKGYLDKPSPARRSNKDKGHHIGMHGRKVRIQCLLNNKIIEGRYHYRHRSRDFQIDISEDEQVVFRFYVLPKKNWIVTWYEKRGGEG
jgi:hypothetical protein